MHKVHIVVDSTAAMLPELLLRHPNLHVVPLTVTLGQRQWREDQLRSAELFSLMQASGEFPKTSQPAPGDFIAILQPIAAAGGEVVVITLSGGLSGTLQSARTAAQLVDAARVSVVDSGTTAIGLVKLAQQALALADAGLTAAEIAGRIAAVSQVTHTLFVPATLEFLRKGGRIGGAAALLGSILQIRPVLYLNGGKVEVLDKVRTWGKALDRIAAEINRYSRLEYIGIVHSDAPQDAAKLQAKLAETLPPERIGISAAGSVLAAHLGPGMVGAVCQLAAAPAGETGI
ncbi:MAG: DegV family protein [Sporomusaceae bacterium]|nr:DegV family protein [Sporomusaceae bacterium]